jgi:hypothetical protein
MSQSMSQSLTDTVAKLGEQVKALRKEGDLAALLAAARDAADEVERRIGDANWNEEQRDALMAVQRWTYNAAADCWPGWSIPSQPSDPYMLVAARELAQHSLDIVERLGVGRQRQGTGIWLCGAFDLALGRYEDASHAFAVAHEHYVAADAASGALLMEGYLAIVQQIGEGGSSGEGSALDQVCARISAGEFKDGAALVAQLRTALAAFT